MSHRLLPNAGANTAAFQPQLHSSDSSVRPVPFAPAVVIVLVAPIEPHIAEVTDHGLVWLGLVCHGPADPAACVNIHLCGTRHGL